jgi:hypothetical protein
MAPGKPPKWSRLLGGLLAGSAYLAGTAAIIGGVTGNPFGLMLLAVVSVAAVSVFLILLWMTLWARRKESRLGQFTVGSLLFLMALVSLYFACSSWVATEMLSVRAVQSRAEGMLAGCVICLVLTLLAVPLLARTSESVIWLAVLVLRSRPLQDWLNARRRRGGP